MTSPLSGYGPPPDVVPPNPGRATLRRSPGGIRLPWLTTLVVLCLLAASFGLLLGRHDQSPVPTPVLAIRASVAHATAQAMRKGIDETIDDLSVLAAVLAAQPEPQWPTLLTRFRAVHDRYLVVYVLDRTGRVREHAGKAALHRELLPRPLPTSVGLTHVRPAGGSPGLLGFVPLAGPAGPLLLVGRYDAAFFHVPLQQLAPGQAYLVDDGGHVVGATGGFVSFAAAPAGFRDALRRSVGGEPSGAALSGHDIVTFAAVRGASPAGQLSLHVLSRVDARTLSLPSNDAHRLALLLSAMTALLSVLCLGWFWLFVIAPVQRVTAEAQRLATGDDRPVFVRRYDEIGLVARALERCRVLLVSSGRR